MAEEISKRIDAIIKERKDTRLPEIERKLELVRNVSVLAGRLRALQEKLSYQKQAGTGNMLALLDYAPMLADTLETLNLQTLENRLEALRKELERLHRRFSRESIQIALIGYARKGKSCFLQSVSGLGDDVIPTSSLTDCTGAVSIIENSKEPFSLNLDYYTIPEFLNAVNTKLKEYFGNRYRVASLDDVERLRGNIVEVENLSKEDIKRVFYRDYIQGVGVYRSCLEGKEPSLFNGEENVVEYVAKYKEFVTGDPIPSRYDKYEREVHGSVTKVLFNKFVAVKAAYVKKEYTFSEAGKIVMVDTIGLGNGHTSDKDKAKMFDVLANDTDVAIYTLLVPETGLSSLPEIEVDKLNEIFETLADYSPERWIVGNVNHFGPDYPLFKNNKVKYDGYISTCQYVRNGLAHTEYGSKDGVKKPMPYWGLVDNTDKEDVTRNILFPVLDLIQNNIDDIDRSFMVSADKRAKELYYEYNSVCETLGKAIGSLEKTNPNYQTEFNRNYENLRLRFALEQYVEKLEGEKDKVCGTIVEDLRPMVDSVLEFVPTKPEIEEALYRMGAKHTQLVFNNFTDNARAKILSALKVVSAGSIRKVQDGVKNEIARILFDDGKLGCLNLSTASNGKPSVEWMDAFCREKLGAYKTLRSAFRSVVAFRMNIEGFLYAKCVKACAPMKAETFISDGGSVGERVDRIWQAVCSAILKVQENLSREFGLSFSILDVEVQEMSMPNLLVWCMVETFMQELVNTGNGEELYGFYAEYATRIWQKEIRMQENIREAVGDILTLSQEMNACCQFSQYVN
ncbi:hypothetical protein [uncultured Parabacteroides sp.]|uniref:hypothetical protein n=1 Tax=uncultured Parabacteroides sp. TaxID=512312 RepID=UPI002638D6B5|nr:hypothetical protein [uncultured Parabacteroides sp.]